MHALLTESFTNHDFFTVKFAYYHIIAKWREAKSEHVIRILTKRTVFLSEEGRENKALPEM